MTHMNALFQLGMDLTRSSTAQEEDLFANSVEKSREERNDFLDRKSVV